MTKTTQQKPILPKDYKDWIKQGDARMKEFYKLELGPVVKFSVVKRKLKDIKGPKK